MFKLKTKKELLYDLFMEIIGKLNNEEIKELANSLLEYTEQDL